MSFTELGLQQTLATRLLNLGYISPSPAHNKTIPAILSGDSLLVCSPLGAGFTESAFLSIISLSATQSRSGQAYVILSASKEHKHITEQRLKLLVGEEIEIDISTDLEGSLLPKPQACIWVSTAKEFHDHLRNTPTIRELSCTLLLTETDEIIARGSKPDLLALSQYLSKQCQVIICTSRVTKSINSISSSLQHNPKRYKLNTNIEEPASIAQQAWPVPENMKAQLLLKLSSKLHNAKVIVMVRNDQTAARLARRMRTRRIRAAALISIGKLDILARFESGDIKILMLPQSTNNSISLEDITHVIYYHFPDNPSDYLDVLNKAPNSVHMSLISPSEEEQLIEIEDILKRPILRNILIDFDYRKQVSNLTDESKSRKKKKQSKRKKKPETKTVWDPDIPRTWGDRNTRPPSPEKIPLEEWSPSPLSSIWLEDNMDRTTNPMPGEKPSRRRRKKYSRNSNENKSSRSKK